MPRGSTTQKRSASAAATASTTARVGQSGTPWDDRRALETMTDSSDSRSAGLGGTRRMIYLNSMSKAITFELDGRTVEAASGETIWQVAQRLGTEIPHLCHAPEPGYRPDGNCRACMVEIEGERVLAASCIRKPAEGRKVRTASERA